jgi:hypothetical protein
MYLRLTIDLTVSLNTAVVTVALSHRKLASAGNLLSVYTQLFSLPDFIRKVLECCKFLAEVPGLLSGKSSFLRDTINWTLCVFFFTVFSYSHVSHTR